MKKCNYYTLSILALVVCGTVFAQIPIPGPIISGGSSGSPGSGTVTDVGITGTSNQITATGTCSGTTTITCNLTIPSGFVLPGTINGLTITTTTGTFTIANAKTLTVNNSVTITGTDGSSLAVPISGTAVTGAPSAGSIPQIGANSVATASGLTVNVDTSVNGSSAITQPAPTTTSAACDWSLSNACVVTAAGGNVTVTFSNPHGSGPYDLTLCNDGTARTWTLPGSAKNAASPSTLSTCTYQIFRYDGSANYIGEAASSNEVGVIRIPEAVSAPGTPAASSAVFYSDPTTHWPTFMANNSATKGVPGQVITCTNQVMTALANTGVITCSTPTLASALFANQGTTVTVLHGNGAGNPSFAVITPSDAAGNTSGSGNFCLTTSCTMVTPALGTPTSEVGTNITGIATGLTSGITNALKSATTTVDVSAATAPSVNQVLTATDSTHATWQAAQGGGGSGGGQAMWSVLPVTSFLASPTQYAPYGGGGLTNVTETSVSSKASGAATISKLHASIDAAFGGSATFSVTLEDGTATASALTCTSSSGGTVCDDTTHSVNVADLDLLSWKIVASGTVTNNTPLIKIGYSVGTSGVGVTSVATGCGMTGGTITTTGTVTMNWVENAQTGTSYTVVSTDCAKLISFSNASAIAVSLPQAAGSFAPPFRFKVQNISAAGTGIVTITPTTSTIQGAATLLLFPGQGGDIISDAGGNWKFVGSLQPKGIFSMNGSVTALTTTPQFSWMVGFSPTETGRIGASPMTGYFRNLRFTTGGTESTGSLTCTFRSASGVGYAGGALTNTALTVTAANGSTANTFVDSTHNVAVTAGDMIGISCSNSTGTGTTVPGIAVELW